jgi:hypothetical protein
MSSEIANLQNKIDSLEKQILLLTQENLKLKKNVSGNISVDVDVDQEEFFYEFSFQGPDNIGLKHKENVYDDNGNYLYNRLLPNPSLKISSKYMFYNNEYPKPSISKFPENFPNYANGPIIWS